jgi:hypothetical protein
MFGYRIPQGAGLRSPLIALGVPRFGGKFIVPRAAGAYDPQDGVPNREFRFGPEQYPGRDLFEIST